MAAEQLSEHPPRARESQLGGDEDLFQFDSLSEGASDTGAPAIRPRASRAASETPSTLAAQAKDAPAGEPEIAATDAPSERTNRRAFPVNLADRNVWLLGAALLLINVAGLGIVLRSQEKVETLAHGVDEKIEKATAKLASAIPAAPAQAPNPRSPRTPTEGDECIQRATHAIERGAFDEARRSLYGLLAVADRLDAATRVDLEARASFLIADSYRLQADKLEGGSR